MTRIRFVIFVKYQEKYCNELIVPMDRLSDQEYLIDEKRCYDSLVQKLKENGVSGDIESLLLPIFDQVFQTSRFTRPPEAVSYDVGPAWLTVIFG